MVKLTLDNETFEVSIIRRRPHLVLRINELEHEITNIPDLGDGSHSVSINGQTTRFMRAAMRDRQIIRSAGRTFEVVMQDPFSDEDGDGGCINVLKAPMPGAVVSVQKRPGETVSRGETILTIESMKLQTALSSPRDGRIEQILRDKGAAFERDEILATLVPEDEKA